MTRLPPWLRWVVAALLLCGVAYVVISGNYLMTALGFASVYVVFVAGLNLFMGYAGQASFGQNAFAAVGGYGSAVLTTQWDWAPVPALVASAVLAAAFAAVVGLVTLRLRGHYLAMGTLAVGLITYEVAVQWESLTGGYMGISGVPPLSIGPFAVETDRQTLLVLLAAAIIAVWLAARLRRSRFGRAMGALAGNEDAASALGVNVAGTKLVAFVAAAVYASVSGSLLAHAVGYISPEVFGLHMVVLGFTMLYVGGVGTALGPLLGALLIGMLPELIRGFRDVQDLVYGVVLIVILIRAPGGLAGMVRA